VHPLGLLAAGAEHVPVDEGPYRRGRGPTWSRPGSVAGLLHLYVLALVPHRFEERTQPAG
jgi:hypothetical protein